MGQERKRAHPGGDQQRQPPVLPIRHLLTLDMLYPKVYNFSMKTIHTTEVFDDWFAGLRDKQAMRRIQARIDRAEDGTSGTANRWVKAFRK